MLDVEGGFKYAENRRTHLDYPCDPVKDRPNQGYIKGSKPINIQGRKMLKVRNAEPGDFSKIMQIYRYAQDSMIQSGNPSQWGHSYPGQELIKSDIREKRCMVIYDKTGIHGVFALFFGEEPTYQVIEDGKWLNEETYVTIHRLAGDGKVHGLFQCAADYCRGISVNIRIDTHDNNKIMQRQLEKNDFIKCGRIYVEDGSPRIAYQWSGKI